MTGVWPLGVQEGHAPHLIRPLQFPNQATSKSFNFKHQGYCFLRMFRNYIDQNFTVMTVYSNNFQLMYSGFSFFLQTQGKQITSRLTFSKVLVLNAAPSEKFSFVDNLKEDNKEPEFKPSIRGGILDLPKKFSKTREAFI